MRTALSGGRLSRGTRVPRGMAIQTRWGSCVPMLWKRRAESRQITAEGAEAEARTRSCASVTLAAPSRYRPGPTRSRSPARTRRVSVSLCTPRAVISRALTITPPRASLRTRLLAVVCVVTFIVAVKCKHFNTTTADEWTSDQTHPEWNRRYEHLRVLEQQGRHRKDKPRFPSNVPLRRETSRQSSACRGSVPSGESVGTPSSRVLKK